MKKADSISKIKDDCHGKPAFYMVKAVFWLVLRDVYKIILGSTIFKLFFSKKATSELINGP